MHLQTTEQRYREFLDTLPLSTLRILGRQLGMSHASSNNKSVLIDEIIDILTGKQQPAPRSNRGAPVKQTYIDPAIFDKLDAHRVEQIVKLVAGDSFGQIFVTDTNRDHLDKILRKIDGDYKLFEVENGNITERKETADEEE